MSAHLRLIRVSLVLILCSVQQSWKERGPGLWYGGREDLDHQLCNVLWADNFWNVSDR